MTSLSELALPDWLDAATLSHPNTLALTFADNRWTYSELHHSVNQTASILTQAVAGFQGRIGILSVNRPEFVFAVHAATRMMVPFVPLNWRQTSEEIAWQLQDASVTVLVVDDEHFALAAAASASLPVNIVSIEDLERAPDVSGTENCARTIDLGQEAAVVYTSGTSGRPKGARISYGNLWFSAIGSMLHLGHRRSDIWLAALPLFHVGGLSILFRAAIGALPVVLHERFDPAPMLAALDDGATLVSVVPTMLQRMLDVRGGTSWPPTVRCVLVGGSSTPSRLIDECLRLSIPVAPTYGLTESASQATTLLPDEAASRPTSSGLPLPPTQVRVVTSSGEAMPGEIGSIEVRGPTLFRGYLSEDDERSGITPDGWFQTGDAGYVDPEGYLYIVDRRDDLIISGGENIYPSEIERVLREHPLVADVGVIGWADESWGSRPVAAVVWQGDPAIAIDELIGHSLEHLATYKIPDHILLLDKLPRSPSGKLLRHVLREQIQEMVEYPG
ncbi:MAG TPA: o-succinylbenzoate--CoA ligase [Thermomicrobiales bacterium]|nr:o-succinylbenzoate--CoA ligase [Thermomicrobiales bacterium]